MTEFLGLYTLNERDEPQRCCDIREWAEWMTQHDTHVAPTASIGVNGITVATVFLGSDPRADHLRGVSPRLFETLVIGGRYHGEVMRYATRREALAGHAIAVQRVTEAYEQGNKAPARFRA